MRGPRRPDFSLGQCQILDLPPAVFFPEDESPVENIKNEIQEAYLERYDEARPYCAACSIRYDCRDWAIATGAWYGYFGGMTPVERWRFAQRHPPAVPVEPPVWVRAEREVLPGLDPSSERDRARVRGAAVAFDSNEGPSW